VGVFYFVSWEKIILQINITVMNLEKVKAKFPKLKIEKIEQKFLFKGEIEVVQHLHVSGLEGNPDITLLLRDEDDENAVLDMPLGEIILFKNYLGLLHNKQVQVILTEIGFRGITIDRNIERGIDIKIHYKNSELHIKIQLVEEDTPLKFIANHIRGSHRKRFRKTTILTITNFPDTNMVNLEDETKNILNSVLFDIEYNFGLSFETIRIDSIKRRLHKKTRIKYEIPSEPIELTYKKYIPELIDYFHTGEKIDYTPFKYVCYFHIIEYFQDKSAFFIVREKLKHIIQKPDFALNINSYVNQALNLIKQESEKHQTDKIKIQRVLKQFIELEDLKKYLAEDDLLGFFEKESIMDCSKPLILPAIDFSESKFFETLTNRIYSIRCSIVHSNPDFDEKKAVPFVASTENIDKLKYEVELIMEIARTIILKSTEK